MEMRRTHDRYPKEPPKPANVPLAGNAGGRITTHRMTPSGAANMPDANLRYPGNRPMHSPISVPPNTDNPGHGEMPNRQMPNRPMPNRPMPNRPMPNLMAASREDMGKRPENRFMHGQTVPPPSADNTGRRYPSNRIMSNPMTSPVHTDNMGIRTQSPAAMPNAGRVNSHYPNNRGMRAPTTTPTQPNVNAPRPTAAPTGGQGTRHFNNQTMRSPATAPNTGRMGSRNTNPAMPKPPGMPAETNNNRPRSV